MKKKKSVRPAAVLVANGTAKVAGLLFIISCSGQPAETQRAVPSEEWGTAKAAPRDAASDASLDTPASADPTGEPATTAGPPMPANPVQAAFRFKRVGKVIPSTNSGTPLPYPWEVIEDGDHQVLLVYLPQMDEGGVGVQVTPVSDQLEPLGEPREYTVETRGRIGTLDIDLEGTGGIWNIASDAQHTLTLGENTMSGRVTRQFVDDAMSEVIQGVFTAPATATYRIEFGGAEELYAFVDTPPQSHVDPFEVTLRAGQILALWAIVDLSIESVSVTIAEVQPSCAPPPAPEE